MPTVRKRGDTWQAMVRVKKAGVVVHAESKTFATEALAKDWGTRLEARIKSQGVPTRRLSTTSLGELILLHGKMLGEGKELRRSREGELAQLAAEFMETNLATLTPSTFTAFARKRRASGAGPATVLHNLMTISAVLSSAKPMFDLDVDATVVREAIKALRANKLVAKAKRRTRRPTDAELALLLEEYDRTADFPSTKIPMAAITRLAIELPRRIGELTEARWDDYRNNVLVLRDTKNPEAPRTEEVPVLPGARAIIAALPVTDERILPYNSESISAAHQRACERLGIKDLHFHDFRREGISRLFKAGYSIPEVSKISGHLNWDMLKIYTDIRATDVLEKFA